MNEHNTALWSTWHHRLERDTTGQLHLMVGDSRAPITRDEARDLADALNRAAGRRWWTWLPFRRTIQKQKGGHGSVQIQINGRDHR